MLPPKPESGMYKNTVASDSPDDTTTSSVHPFWSESSAESSAADELLRKRKWRASPDDVAKFREFAKKFEGTHNFHNFTVGRDFKDKSCIRFMRSIEVRSSSSCAYWTDCAERILGGRSRCVRRN